MLQIIALLTLTISATAYAIHGVHKHNNPGNTRSVYKRTGATCLILSALTLGALKLAPVPTIHHHEQYRISVDAQGLWFTYTADGGYKAIIDDGGQKKSLVMPAWTLVQSGEVAQVSVDWDDTEGASIWVRPLVSELVWPVKASYVLQTPTGEPK